MADLPGVCHLPLLNRGPDLHAVVSPLKRLGSFVATEERLGSPAGQKPLTMLKPSGQGQGQGIGGIVGAGDLVEI